MPKASEISEWKERYSTYSDEQLIAEKYQWVENSEMHIAAVQLLHERQQLTQQKAIDISRELHAESLRQEKALHRKTQAVAWIAVAVAAVAAALAVPPLLSRSKDVAQSQLPASPTPAATPTKSASPAPPKAMSAPEKQLITPQDP